MDKSVETYSNGLKCQGLSEEACSENALLRSRIDEQSQLIMILKQRSDDSVAAMRAAEKRSTNLEEQRLQLEQNLELAIKRCNMLDSRFNDLASNHQQMIEFKDEYKRQNAQLLTENEKLRSDNSRLFSAAIEERNATINDLQNANSDLRHKVTSVETQYRQSLSELEKLNSNHQAQLTQLKSELDASKKQVQRTENELQETRKQLQQLAASQSSADAESQSLIQKLTHERDELTELSMSRGRIIQEKHGENSVLQKKLENMAKTMKELQIKHEREAAALSVDKEVQRMKKCIAEEQQKYKSLIQEFEVFKKHSMSMLEQERQLNEKLRHLTT